MQMFNSGEEPELPVTSGKWSLFFLCLICGALVSSLRRSKKPSRAVNLTHGLEPEVVVQHLSLSWAAGSPTPLCRNTGELQPGFRYPGPVSQGKGRGPGLENPTSPSIGFQLRGRVTNLPIRWGPWVLHGTNPTF